MRVKLFLIITCFIFSCRQWENDNKLNFLEVKDKTLIPEGVAVHPSTSKVYLSSLHQNKIVSVDDKGNVADVITSGQQGFMWGLGMKFSLNGKILWACTADGKGKTALVAVDHKSGRIIKKYMHDSARFFNDLVLLNDGRIFITDTDLGALFMLKNDSLYLFSRDEKIKWCNGITAKDNILFVASGRYGIIKVDAETGVVTSATGDKREDYAIDGLTFHDNTLYAVIGWPQDSTHQHRIIRYHLDQQLNYKGMDTLFINEKWLTNPTTLALHNDKLFALSTTNLGIYNRHEQKTESIMDSLVYPVVTVFELE